MHVKRSSIRIEKPGAVPRAWSLPRAPHVVVFFSAHSTFFKSKSGSSLILNTKKVHPNFFTSHVGPAICLRPGPRIPSGRPWKNLSFSLFPQFSWSEGLKKKRYQEQKRSQIVNFTPDKRTTIDPEPGQQGLMFGWWTLSNVKIPLFRYDVYSSPFRPIMCPIMFPKRMLHLERGIQKVSEVTVKSGPKIVCSVANQKACSSFTCF